MMLEEPSALAEVLPTFAAAAWTPAGRVCVTTDHLGFRHVFHGQRAGAGIISTSSRAVARELGAGLDLEALAIQSALGWQVGLRTMFEGVSKLAAGGMATVEDDGLSLSSYLTPREAPPVRLDVAVVMAADLLRTYLEAYLEDRPDAGLQLTGGQDSRLLLSAVPKARRRGLRVVTLGRRGEPDVDIAADLADRYGMEHELLSLASLEKTSPSRAFELCVAAAHRVEYSADPLAHAALTHAEARSRAGPRISGLGGEVSRGFYYLGLPTRAPVSPRRVRRLTTWRMFVNEAVPAEALAPDFRQWSREFATGEVEKVLAGTGLPWMRATDDLYLRHRMQRWAGVTETAVCRDREVVNPMLDDRFIAIATGLDPRDKRNSRFLGLLQLELDPELGSLPLDGRPAPAAYARRSTRNSARQGAATMTKAGSKVVQRLRHANRPAAGGDILSTKVVEHLRDHSSLLEPLRALEVFSEEWLDTLVTTGTVAPSSAVALLVNLIAALDTDDTSRAP